ncbi:MAG: ATP-binding protein, partial [Anaerolineae bacterium]
ALDFVRRNMRVAAVFDEGNKGRRRDVPEYPLEAVREVITNAVAHRDFASTGRVQLHMFEDRLEVGNPGGLPGDLTLEEVTERGGASYPRNPTISRVLRDWGYMEEVGRGLLYIQRRMRDLGSEAPLFESTPARFTVTLPSRHRTLSHSEE